FGPSGPAYGIRRKIMENLLFDYERLLKEIENEKGNELTSRISILFHLLGFATCDLGLTDGEFPDVMAYPESPGWVLAIECSSRSDEIGRKMSRLATRTKQIGRGLDNMVVIPVYFTNLSKDMIIPSDLATA